MYCAGICRKTSQVPAALYVSHCNEGQDCSFPWYFLFECVFYSLILSDCVGGWTLSC